MKGARALVSCEEVEFAEKQSITFKYIGYELCTNAEDVMLLLANEQQ